MLKSIPLVVLSGLSLSLLSAVTPSTQAQTFQVIHSFTGGADGGYPGANLIKDKAGNLYGTTAQGGDLNCNIPTGEPVEAGCGVVFKLSPMGKETVLYSFPGGVQGGNPSGLVRDTNGSLYGTTDTGGNLTCNAPYGCGTVFKVSKKGAEDVLYSFTNVVLPDGSTYSTSPEGGVIRDKEGNFYGTTEFGGTALYCTLVAQLIGCGTIFKVDPTTDMDSVLYSFSGGLDPYNTDGGLPQGSSLIMDAQGNLYGTTPLGGGNGTLEGVGQCTVELETFGCGVVFKVDPSGNETVLYRFVGGPTDGAYPVAGLIIDAEGNLYGTTRSGGGPVFMDQEQTGQGTVFKIDPSGNETVLYIFCRSAANPCPDGASPLANLVRDAEGNLYGTTYAGGASNLGTVFKLDPSGNETVLHSFAGGSDGENPTVGLVLDRGSLYGTTELGGNTNCNCGVVFKVSSGSRQSLR